MRHVVVEDASSIALRCVRWGEEDGLTEADDEDGDGDSEPEPGDAAESGGALLHRVSLPRIWLFGVEHGFKEQDADGGEDDVVAG